MNWKELDESLHQVEEFEKKNYLALQRRQACG